MRGGGIYDSLSVSSSLYESFKFWKFGVSTSI